MGSRVRRQKVLSAIKILSKRKGVTAYSLAKTLFKDYTSSERALVRSQLDEAVKEGLLMKHGSRYELASNKLSRSSRTKQRRTTKTRSSISARRSRRNQIRRRTRSRNLSRRRNKSPMSYFQKKR